MEFRRRKTTTTQNHQQSSSTEESPKKKRREEKCFEINEKILCFEPDEKLEKVLYDAKIRDVQEIIKKGKKCFEYLVHFQGWNNSWDRKVSEDFILKDTPENRKLQRELAEKKQLQLGAYLYRKERKKRKKLIERNLLCGAGSDEAKKNNQNDLEHEFYYSSSTTESHDDDRVFLHIGEILKKNLEFDHTMVTKEKIFAKLPAKLSVISILENFVKSYSIKVVTKPPSQEPQQQKPKKNILGRITTEQKMKPIDYDAIINDVNLCKEIADGLRVYFNFILNDFLLYPEEKQEFERIMSDENIKNFKYTQNEVHRLSLNDFFNKESINNENPIRLSRLRSHSLKIDEDERLENLSSMASTSSNDSFLHDLQRNTLPSMPQNPTARKIIEDIFNWNLIDQESNQSVEPSMIYGICHLSRLIVKLPEFLSATPMNEEKMTVLLKYLDSFVEFLEENTEIYGAHNYTEIKIEKSESDE